MQIAVTSQNVRTVSGHAGRSRRFLLYEVDGVEVLVTASCGEGFREKMARRGIRVVLTELQDPSSAATAAYRDAARPG